MPRRARAASQNFAHSTLLLALVCAPAWLAGAAPSASQEAPVAAPQQASSVLQTVTVTRDGAELVVSFVSSDPLALVGVQPDPDGSIVVQLPNQAPGPAVRDLFPEQDLVLAIRISHEPTARGPLTKAVITPRSPLSYSFAPEGRELKIRLRARGTPSTTGEAESLRRRLRELETALASARQERDRLSSRVAALSADRDLLAGRFEQLEVRRRDLEAALEATLDEIQSLAGASARPGTSEELAAVRRERDDLAQRVAELTGDLEKALVVRDESEAQIQVWRAELDRVEQGAEVSGDERTTAELQQRLSQALADQRRLEERLASARTAGISRGRTRGGVHLRQGPGTDTASLTLLPEGVSLEVLGRQGDWVQVRAGSREGWVYGLLIELESETVNRLQTALAEAQSERDALSERLSTHTSVDAAEDLAELRETNRALGEELDRLRTQGVHRGSTISEANLRSGPGLDLPVVSTLRPGTTVEILDRSDEWLRVRAGQDEGWVYEKLLELESDELARLRGQIAAVRGERDTLRQRLDEAQRSLAETDLGRRLAVVEGERDALRAELERAPRGLAADRTESSRGRTLTGVHLRQEPSVESRSLMLIPADTHVELLGLEEGWYRVRQGTTEGWAFADLLTPVSEEIARLENELDAARREVVRLRQSQPRAASPVTGSTEAWILENVNLRSEPGMQHGILGVLEAGTRVTVLDSSGSWHRVSDGALEGWVYRDYLSGTRTPSAAASTGAGAGTASAAVSPTADSPLPPATPLPVPSHRASPPTTAPDGIPARTLARVFLRAGPGADQESIALISEDTLIHILEERGDWRRVVVRGTEGWMYAPLLEPLD